MKKGSFERQLGARLRIRALMAFGLSREEATAVEEGRGKIVFQQVRPGKQADIQPTPPVTFAGKSQLTGIE